MKHMTFRHAACAFSSLVFLSGAVSQESAAQAVNLQYGSDNTPGSLPQVTDLEFIRLVQERSGGKVKITYFDSGQIGTQRELLQKAKLGTQDFMSASSIMSTVLPELGVYDMPYLVKDRAHAECIAKKIIMPKLAPKLEAQGYKLLGVWENGFRQITNNVRPIATPADLKGIKLRVPQGVWRMKMFQAFGANPAPLAYSETFVALQTGVMDGQENPYSAIWGAKFNEVQKYLSETNHSYTPLYLIASMARFKRLPPDIQKLLEQAGADVQAYAFKKSAELDDTDRKKLIAAGMQFNKADRDTFVAASTPIYEAFGKEVPGGKELVDEVLALASGC
ncbi:MAG: TRAP transporter substrate-binding protein [Betaproteobacteria bacterium]